MLRPLEDVRVLVSNGDAYMAAISDVADEKGWANRWIGPPSPPAEEEDTREEINNDDRSRSPKKSSPDSKAAGGRPSKPSPKAKRQGS